jgi:peptide/nickel transport system permease protein
MLAYIARRLGFGLILALLVTMITYALLSLSFATTTKALAGGLNASPQTVEALTVRLGFDRPLYVQYLDWLSHAVRGDFGRSLFTGEEVVSALGTRLIVTLSLVLVALALTVAISVALGVAAASRGGAVDRGVQILILLGYVFPGLLLAIGLVYLLAVNLQWLPATGYTSFAVDPGKWARSIAIPVIVLTIGGTANLTSQIRGAMIDELRKDYVRTLRTRGLSTRALTLKHALRNAGGPALTVLSLEFIGMLGGALIIEKVFALPGFGTYSYGASVRGDIPVILALSAFGVILVVGINLITDLLQGWLNPKARVS